MSQRAAKLYVIRLSVLSGIILMQTAPSRGEVTAPPSHETQPDSMAGLPQKTKQLEFKIVRTALLRNEENIMLSRTDYEASDRAAVTVIHGEFPSSAAAQEYLEKVLAKALKIIERGEKKDSEGKVVGKRARALAPTGEADKPIPTILCTYGKDFYEIQSYDSPGDSRIMEMKLTSSN
jgi:hypothetical protein